MFKDSYVPKYVLIVNDIKDEIENGELAVKQRVSSENEIKNKYNVSTTTARKSLDVLRNMGLIESVQGRGSFVRNGKQINKNLQKILSFTSTMQMENSKASAIVLEKEILLGNDIFHKKLGLKKEDPVLKLRRLRFGNDKPLVIDNRYINIKFCPNIIEKDLSQSLYEIYEGYNLKLLRETQIIEIGNLTKKDAKLLNCKVNDPAFFLHCIVYTLNDVPLEYEESFYKGKEFRFIVEAKS